MTGKAVLTNRILLTRTDELTEYISKCLTFKFEENVFTGKGTVVPKVVVERLYSLPTSGIISMPIGAIDLIPSDYTIVDKRCYNKAVFPDMNITLLESQQQVLDSVTGSCVINAKPGFGKTISALAIAHKFKLKTLVITHTVKLRKQWEAEVEKVFGIKAGVIGSGKFDIDHPIVIANIQSLIKVHGSVSKEFGLLFNDETHHAPAKSFTDVINGSYAAIKIGLSGTLTRKDGRHIYITKYISETILSPDNDNTMTPTILVANTPLRFPKGKVWANRLTELYESKEYTQLVIDLAITQAERGHIVLVLSDRVEFLQRLHANTPNSICITGVTEGQEELEEMVRNSEVGIVYGTVGIFKEGISINQLSCAILASPINNESLVIQIIGRVIRKLENKLPPEVVDIKLACHTGYNQFTTRLAAYHKMGYKVLNVQLQ